MIIFRIGFLGYNLASFTDAIVLSIMAASCSTILKLSWPVKSKYWLMVVFCTLLSSFKFYILIADKGFLFYILPAYILILIVVAFFSYAVFMYIKQSSELFRRYKEESRTDFLTGLYNHRQFGRMLDMQMEIVREGNEQLSILAIDIDHFKAVNDTYGHLDGDKVLQQLGLILKKTTRKFDIVARCGGEEFSVLLLDCPHQRAIEIAKRICLTVEKEDFPISSGRMINITLSIGVSTFPETTKDIQFLRKQADKALYAAKHSGRNRVCALVS
jgi:diguanylate cyclase